MERLFTNTVALLAWVVFSTLVFSAPIEGTGTPAPQEGVVEPTGPAWPADERLKREEIDSALEALRAGNVEQCLARLKSASAKDPSLPPDWLMLAYLYLANGRGQEGVAALERAAVEYRAHPEVYQALGQVALLQSRHADAWAHFQHALRLDAPQGWKPEQVKAFHTKCYSELADVSEARGDWGTAAEALGRVAKSQAPDAALLGRWAKALLWAGHEETAIAKLREAHALDAALNPPELSVAALYTERGSYEQARAWYERAAQAYPQDARVHFEYAGGLLLAGKPDEAAAQIAKAAAGGKLESLKEPMLLLGGLIARKQRKYDDAERRLKELLKISPGHPGALYHLPIVLVEQPDEGKRKQALQIAMMQAQKHPESSAAQASLGWVHFRMDKKQEAEDALREAASYPMIDGETLYLLVQVLVTNGKASEAAPYVERLRAAVASPGLFLLRDEARQWLESASFVLE